MNSKTKEIFYEDMYLQKMMATVVDCRPNKKDTNTWEIVLDGTVFYPEGGGQYGDKGRMLDIVTQTKAAVLDTYHDNEVIVHLCDAAIKVGNKVEIQIDWELRYARMQEHSGEHLVSGLIVKHYGYQNVGFHMGNHDITIDYNGVVEKDVLEEIEIRANQIIYENLPIEVLYPSKEELEGLVFRSKKELDGQIRLIRIHEVDVCACCGTHVKTTGEIGLIHFTDIIPYKGGSRITMQIGVHALLDYIKKDKIVKRLNHLLSSKTEELTRKTAESLQKQEDFKQESKGFQMKYLQLLLDTTFDENLHIVEVEGVDAKLIPGLVNDRLEQTKILVLLNETSHKKDPKMMVTIGASALDLTRILPMLREKKLLKGGGSKRMLQGEWLGSVEELRHILLPYTNDLDTKENYEV